MTIGLLPSPIIKELRSMAEPNIDDLATTLAPYGCGCVRLCPLKEASLDDLCHWHRKRYEMYTEKTSDPIDLLSWLCFYFRYFV